MDFIIISEQLADCHIHYKNSRTNKPNGVVV